jgi:site-specific DNA-adenine methylase
MTSYHGGKQRIGKKIAEVIHKKSSEADFVIKGYCEPFCGMLGVYQHIPELFGPRLKYFGSDLNKSVILMWKASQKGWKPPQKKISKKEFMRLKYDGKSSAEKGFIGHFYGYMGKYFQPFDDRAKSTKNVTDRISSISEDLEDVKFSHGPYTKFSGLKNFIIYCDPPYSKQAHYYNESGDHVEPFDHEAFWSWCAKMSENNIVFVSEYKAPKGAAKCVWSCISKTTGKSQKERLYML